MTTPMSFYALGKRMYKSNSAQNLLEKASFQKTNLCNNAYRDKSNDILERNIFSVNSSNFDLKKDNYKSAKILQDSNQNDNNYLNPIPSLQRQYKFDLKPYLLNKFTLQKYITHFFVNDVSRANVTNGTLLSKNDYTSEKKSFIENNQSISEIKGVNNSQKTMLNNNLLVNEKNVKGEIIRHPKGFWNFNQE